MADESASAIVARIGKDRMVLFDALVAIHEYATDLRAPHRDRIWAIIEGAMRNLSVPSCFAPKDRADG